MCIHHMSQISAFLYVVYKQMRVKNKREHFSAIAKEYCEYPRAEITGRINWRSHIHTVTCAYHCCNNSKECRLQKERYLIPLFTEERNEKTQKTCAGYLKHCSMKHFSEISRFPSQTNVSDFFSNNKEVDNKRSYSIINLVNECAAI